MLPHDLIATARKLATIGEVGAPKQSDLKRAQSTVYYAMFHAICRNCADTLVGKIKTPSRSQGAWNQAYRAVNHVHAKKQCMQTPSLSFPDAIQDFANLFTASQEKRHKADYDPSFSLTRRDVLTEIESAAVAIARFQRAPRKDRTAFAVWTVAQYRRD